jgi:zinc transport system substrate-binding protein
MKCNLRTIIFLFVVFFGYNNAAYCLEVGRDPKITSSINPVYQIVNFITGDDKNNHLLINPRISEHHYYFKPSDIDKIKKSDVVFYIGGSLESNLSQIIAKSKEELEGKINDISLIETNGLKLINFYSSFGEKKIDSHIWLNPQNAMLMAANIANVLSKINPDKAKDYQKNLNKFVEQVEEIDRANRLKLVKVPQKSFITYHNSTAYFEDYYQIKASSFMVYYRSDELTIKRLQKLNDLIKKDKVSCIANTPQEQNSIAKQLALNNKINFASVDIIGDNNPYNNKYENGYVELMSNFVDDLVKCVNN